MPTKPKSDMELQTQASIKAFADGLERVAMPTKPRARRVTLYRDDSTVQVVYDDAKTVFWTAGNTVLVVARFKGDGPEHYYVHWPRERFCWFKDEPNVD